ncbi:hypothetical protein FXO37_26641 [Capsicum annuum]|nr:hypothetical protein FXO37_26641 [Capsicum annuum]
MEKEEEIEECSTACFHLVSAFLACEPPDFVISFARDFGGGFITERVQSFLWNECINKSDVKCNLPYLKRFLKKLIVEIESNGDVVLDELYEKYIFCLASVKIVHKPRVVKYLGNWKSRCNVHLTCLKAIQGAQFGHQVCSFQSSYYLFQKCSQANLVLSWGVTYTASYGLSILRTLRFVQPNEICLDLGLRFSPPYRDLPRLSLNSGPYRQG